MKYWPREPIKDSLKTQKQSTDKSEKNFEDELHRFEITGLKKKIKKLKQRNLEKFKERAAYKKQVVQKQITLVLLIFTLIWFFLLMMIWFN